MFCECVNLVKKFDGRNVLDIERLKISAGKITAVVGANGSGKTTLLEIIAMLLKADSGDMKLWGKPARAGRAGRAGRASVAGRAELRKKVIMVMHPGYMFHGTVLHNIRFGLRGRGFCGEEISRHAVRAVEMLELDDLAHRDARKLSAGQKQRVNIARAIAINLAHAHATNDKRRTGGTPVPTSDGMAILFDEPLANLDDESATIIKNVIKKINSDGCTILHAAPAAGTLDDITDNVISLKG